MDTASVSITSLNILNVLQSKISAGDKFVSGSDVSRGVPAEVAEIMS